MIGFLVKIKDKRILILFGFNYKKIQYEKI